MPQPPRSWWHMLVRSAVRSLWPAYLFAGSFVMLGLAAFCLAWYPVVQHLRALSWQATPAVLLSLGEVSGGRSTVSRLEGEFSYDWQGRAYQSQQISFSLMRDHLDDGWRALLHDRLGEPGSAIRVLVNPVRPQEAVAVAAIRWAEFGVTLLAAGCFGLPGLALLLALMRGSAAQAPPSGRVSWPTVLTLLASSPLWLILAYLLWSDEHELWAGVACVPVLLALNGVWAGCREARQHR